MEEEFFSSMPLPYFFHASYWEKGGSKVGERWLVTGRKVAPFFEILERI